MGAAPPFSSRLLGVTEDLQAGWAAERDESELVGVNLVDNMVGVFGIGVGQKLIAPLHELLGMVVRDPQKATQHAHWKHASHLGYEVELSKRECFIEDAGCEFPDWLFVGLDCHTGETPVDEPAQPGVVGRVELHEGSSGLGFLGVHLLEADA